MKHLSLYISCLAGLLCATFAAAQPPVNHFEIHLANGWTQNRAASEFGPRQPNATLGLDQRLGLVYTRRPSEAWSWSAGWGWGRQAFSYDVLPEELYSASIRDNFQKPRYFRYQRLELGASYWHALGERNFLKLNMGGGATWFDAAAIPLRQRLRLQPDYEDYYLERMYSSGILPFLSAGPELRRVLKNKNQLVLKLEYLYSFRNVYEGTYRLDDGSSGGRLFNSGNMLSLGAGFVFTSEAHQERLANLPPDKVAKRVARQEARYIHPQSWFIAAYGGFGKGILKSEDPHGVFRDDGLVAFTPRLTLEKGVAHSFFAELGYHFLNYRGKYWYESFYASPGVNIFPTHHLSMGGGYRIITKRNYPLLNLHFGIALGFHSQPLGYSGSDGRVIQRFVPYDLDLSLDEIQYVVTTSFNSRLIFSSYLGASKDFRLTQRLYLAMMYRYQIGWINFLVRDFDYEHSRFAGPISFQAYLDGTERTLQLGLKYKL